MITVALPGLSYMVSAWFLSFQTNTELILEWWVWEKPHVLVLILQDDSLSSGVFYLICFVFPVFSRHIYLFWFTSFLTASLSFLTTSICVFYTLLLYLLCLVDIGFLETCHHGHFRITFRVCSSPCAPWSRMLICPPFPFHPLSVSFLHL